MNNNERYCRQCNHLKPIEEFERPTARKCHSCLVKNRAECQKKCVKKRRIYLKSTVGRKCKKCKQLKPPEKFKGPRTYCDDCHNIMRNKHYKKNRKKIGVYMKILNARNSNNLTEGHIIKVLKRDVGVPSECITTEIIEMKRDQLRLMRSIRQINNEIN